MAIGMRPTTISRKPDESFNNYMDRILFSPIANSVMYWASPEELTTWEKNYWTANIFGRRYYIRKLFLSVVFLVILSKMVLLLLPTQDLVLSSKRNNF